MTITLTKESVGKTYVLLNGDKALIIYDNFKASYKGEPTTSFFLGIRSPKDSEDNYTVLFSPQGVAARDPKEFSILREDFPLFPLRAGVAYRTRNGGIIIPVPKTAKEMTIPGNMGLEWRIENGRCSAYEETPFDIIDFADKE